jgi:hypothetical protein
MHPLYSEFITHLDHHDKDKCVQLATTNMADRTLDIVSLYEEIISPAQYAGTNSFSLKPIGIWEEHLCSPGKGYQVPFPFPGKGDGGLSAG